MTRLANQDANKGEARTGPNAAVVDKILGLSNDRKRARPVPAGTVASTLDYKGDTTAAAGKQVTPRHFKTQTAAANDAAPAATTTRARGSNGIPPRAVDMADLEGMDAEQILQAMYDNPDLVKAAADYVDQEKKTGPKKQRGTYDKNRKKKSPTYQRNPDGKVVMESADRLELMKEEGFPYTQWVVILLWLGVAVYHVLKVWRGPRKTGTSFVTVKKVKGKGKKGPKRSVPAAEPKFNSANVNKIAAQIEGTKKTATATKWQQQQSAAVSKGKKKAKPRKIKPAAAAAGKKTDGVESPDYVSTDGSSSTTGEAAQHSMPNAAATAAAAQSKLKVATPTVTDEAFLDDGDWQTVGVKTTTVDEEVKPKAPAKRQVSKEHEPVHNEPKVTEKPALNGLVKPKAPKSAAAAATTTATVVAEENTQNDKSEEMTAVQSKQSKKKKNAKNPANGSSNGSTNNSTERKMSSSTDADAAFAQQLQAEEVAPHGVNAAAGDDFWEEVTQKKKKLAKA